MDQTDPNETTLLAIKATLERGKLYATQYIRDIIRVDQFNAENLGARLNVSP